MDSDNVQSSQGVTLVGAGAPDRQDIVEALNIAPMLVAADGGANFCVAAGFRPEAVIGDFDSLDIGTAGALDGTRMIRVAEQETTDFEKCLARISAPFVIATGFTMGRLDHAMAVWSVLARRIGPPTIVIGQDDLVFAAPERLRLDLPLGTRLSLFPLAPVTGTSGGLEWPIDGLTLSPLGRLGTSNRVMGEVRLQFDAPGCLVITPRAALAEVLISLIGRRAAPER